MITPARLIPAMHEHLRFIGALQKRDVAGATELLNAHIRSARDRVITEPLEPAQAEWLALSPPATKPRGIPRKRKPT